MSTEKVEQMRTEFLAEDSNSDGRVSLEEFKAYHKRSEGWLGAYDEAKTEGEFGKLDHNGDGFLMLDEYLESCFCPPEKQSTCRTGRQISTLAGGGKLGPADAAHLYLFVMKDVITKVGYISLLFFWGLTFFGWFRR